MAQSQALAKFYKDIQQWIDSGFNFHPAFDTGVGLCSNLKWWWTHGLHKGLEWSLENLRHEMCQQFVQSGLDTGSPFNEDDSYWFEENKYTNPKRLQWIKDHSL